MCVADTNVMAPQRKLKETYFDDNFSSSANRVYTNNSENFQQETDVMRFYGSTYVNMHHHPELH